MSSPSLPAKPFSVLPLRRGVLFPGTTLSLPVGRERSVALVQTLSAGDLIVVATQKDGAVETPGSGDLHPIATFARVVEVGRVATGEHRLTVEGLGRVTIDRVLRDDPFIEAEGRPVDDIDDATLESKALARALADQITANERNGRPLAAIADPEGRPGLFADRLAAALGLPPDREIAVLGEARVPARLHLVGELLRDTRAATEVKRKIEQDVRREIGKDQREALLREQLRAIKKELGEDKSEDAVGGLRERLDKAGLSPEARTVADRELARLEALSPQQAEHGVVRTYLELIADLPWSARSEAKHDLKGVSAKLDADHAGLGDVKRRILEHMAVMELRGTTKGSILCLAGPPGVGKTSLGQSIADATGRPFVRVALGGVRDEAEVRGHRRTYVGALPGRILHALKKAKVKNPVILLDEIDKLGSGWQGSPEAALLEVLDPEQNGTFTDHYLEIPFDLSEVLFVCTANDLSTISAPLRDRLEILELGGYTAAEKIAIARSHLLPKQLKEHALEPAWLTVEDDALAHVVSSYTREAGVRQLERELKKLCRAVALEVARAEGARPSVVVREADLSKYLGKPRYFDEVAERTSFPGIATGLAWTPVGGDILFIETSRMRGKGRVEITGQLGDVMKESAKAAFTYVRSHAEDLGIDTRDLEEQDIHIHVPAGAVPKDGPSAGVTMFTALTSLLSHRRVRPDTAMTGECTLRGKVLPVGGIKGKVLAAHRAGIKRIILPERNRLDLEDVPQEARDAIEFVFATDMSDVLAAALEPLTPVVSPLASEPGARAQA